MAVCLVKSYIHTWQYPSERGVGEEVRTCGVPREQLFVVSNVAAEHKTYEQAKAGIDETLKKMGLDYLDMMIIHSPQPLAEVNRSENRYKEGNRQAWKALEEAYNEGKLKVIGVSNFHRIFHISSFLPETSWIHFQLLQITSLFLSRPYTVCYLYWYHYRYYPNR